VFEYRGDEFAVLDASFELFGQGFFLEDALFVVMRRRKTDVEGASFRGEDFDVEALLAKIDLAAIGSIDHDRGTFS